MESLTLAKAITALNASQTKFFTTATLGSALGHIKPNSLYKAIYRLEKSKIITRLDSGKYYYGPEAPMSFQITNFLVQPSYISLETALNLYGILSQFPRMDTSVTTNKTKSVIIHEYEYEYTHISKDLYWGFIKTDGYLIATPEKAIIDNFYLACMGLRSASTDEWDWEMIDKKRLVEYAKLVKYIPFQKYFTKHAQL